MRRDIDIKVKIDDVFMNAMKPFIRSEDDGIFKRLIWNGEQASGIFEREASRFHITLSKVIDTSDLFIVAVPNFYVCMETKTPHTCSNKIGEQGVPAIDAESIEMAIRHMKKAMEEFTEYDSKDVHGRLIDANYHLNQARTLLQEENTEDKQMDYVSHPSLANAFDLVDRQVKAIDKIMYQK